MTEAVKLSVCNHCFLSVLVLNTFITVEQNTSTGAILHIMKLEDEAGGCSETGVLVVRLYFIKALRQSDLLLAFLHFPTLGGGVLVPWIVLLSGEALALAGGHHVDFIDPGAAVVALQLDPLGPGPVYDAAPVLTVLPAPVSLVETPDPDPVGRQMSWQTLPGTHQLFDGVDAGALTVRDVLCGSEFPAFQLALVWVWNTKVYG